jgi:glycosyltransferase involved in cell wall biosynthesis
MKVLICIPCLMTGGTEIQTLNFIRALIKGGHRIVTVCYFEYCQEMVTRFQQAGSEVICFSKEGARIRGWKGIVFLFKKFRKVLKQYRPEVVHVQYMAPGAIPILLLRLLGIRKIITTAHTFADIYPNLWLVHFVQRHCVRAFTCITKLAECSFFGTYQLYTEQTRLKKRNHFTIYNTLPIGFSISRKAKNWDRPLTIGVVSRLESIKGMDLVVPAFTRVSICHKEMRLLVVGDGTLRKQMEKQVHEAGLEDFVEFVGKQSQEMLPSYYDRIDILLMPSRSEGFGLTAIEGMARGCVVVAAHTGGLPEVVLDREVGLLHKSEQVDDLVTKINTLIEQPMLWKRYSIEAITYVQQFSFERFSQLFNNLYKKL